jgi:hypothetical protein
MNTEQKNQDQNALSIRVNQYWGNFKQGKIISYKLMAALLLLVATAGTLIYIFYERGKADSKLWVELEEANTLTSLEDISKNNPNTIQDRLARLQIARNQLGVAGIDRLGVINPELRKKAVENIETARESLKKLLDEFKDDPVFKVECLYGLAMSEAALVAVPTKEGQLTEFKGSVPKVVEWLDKLAEAAAPGTPWANDSKTLADSLRDPNSATAHEFVHVQQALFRPAIPDPGAGTEPFLPGFTPPGPIGGLPKGPLFPPGVPNPIGPSKGPETPQTPQPGGPIVPPAPGTDPKTPKDPSAPIPPPKPPDAKAPDTTPKIPEPKAPVKPGEPTPPNTPPEKKP